jgi:hypothetical protein
MPWVSINPHEIPKGEVIPSRFQEKIFGGIAYEYWVGDGPKQYRTEMMIDEVGRTEIKFFKWQEQEGGMYL